MDDYLDGLRSELKRVDHLFYVSLKYTRTVDVIRSIMERLLNTYDIGFGALLAKTKKRRKNLEIPVQPRKRCEVVREIFANDQKIIDYVDFYLEIRDIFQAKYDKRKEYRRNVTMISHLAVGYDVEVNIDLILEFFNKTKVFAEYLVEKKT